jgi:trimeric autotransporter adhesin
MSSWSRIVVCLLFSLTASFGQNSGFPYVFHTIAGSFPIGDKGPATYALLDLPDAVVVDSTGNVYICDSNDFAIRKVTNGTITTIATLGAYVNDMKLGPDGNFYLAATARVYKLTPAGVVTLIAGTGVVGSNGDGGNAAGAQVGNVLGICLDAQGNIYISETNKIREITTDGKIKTIAGTGIAGYNGDNIAATTAQLYMPAGLVIDASGNLYVADQMNFRIRKISPQGTITTALGTGFIANPTRNATNSSIGIPVSLALDSNGNLYFTDDFFEAILKMSGSVLSVVAGDGATWDTPSDGVATAVSLWNPVGLAIDSTGTVYVADSTNRVRIVTTDGQMRTIAGRFHFSGDGGPAAQAVFNQPDDVAIDASGNVFVADGYNFRIRKIAVDGTTSTYSGTGVPNYPAENAQAAGQPLGYINSIVFDAAGNLYVTTLSKVLKATPNGVFTTFAGNGNYADSGDNGPASKASLMNPYALAVDALGNVYVADSDANRVRKISPDGTITAYAGSGATGYKGDGGLAPSALFNFKNGTSLTVDRAGNVYIADTGNLVVRMVTPNGILSTVAGNGKRGIPTDGQPAISSPLSVISTMAADKDGNVFLASLDYGQIYEMSGGLLRTISGATLAPLAEGIPAVNALFFPLGIKVDANGDIYAADGANSMIRKLVLNSPIGMTITDGNNQSATTGANVARPLKVMVNGRAGGPVGGITVAYAVNSGTATLTASTTQTDATGVAGVVVTLGSTAGPVIVTASIPGSTVPPVQFNLTAISPLPPGCTASTPVITSVASAGDFGGSATFASGSWLEIKGSNLSTTSRQWAGSDFTGSNAPTNLDGVSASINGHNGYTLYVSPTQINVQAPSDATVGPIAVTVTNCAGASHPVTAQKAVLAPGMLAPSSFNIGGKQYLVGVLGDGSYVGNPNLIPGAAFRPAAPGDTITAYGIGFGDVTPATPPGVVVAQSNNLSNFLLSFGTTSANVAYAGLAPGYVGLYQFNFTVPDVPDNDYLMDIRVGGQKISQTLYLTVHR